MVWNLDGYCSKSHRPSHNTSLKLQTQGSKDSSHSKESKPKNLKSAPPCNDKAESIKKESEKKKKSWEHRRKRIGKWKKQSLAIGVNTKAPKKKIRAKCFNYNKKSHYTNNCIEPSKN